MPTYVCDICAKTFAQKGHFETHKNRKNSCKKNATLDELVEQKVQEVLSKKKNLGQYFTISDHLQTFVFDHVEHKKSLLLEPSFGAGHLLQKFKQLDENYPMICYELDDQIKPVVTFNQNQTVVYGDFTKQKVTQKFKTIIGNPPYVKQSSGNLYIKFIELCYEYLDTDGEIIFIVPSDFIKLTSASSIIDTMTKYGSFTHFLFPHDEKLFEGASVDIVVFRYRKGLKSNKTIMNGKEVFCNVKKGIITFSESEVTTSTTIENQFHVYVGLVSGRDEIYRVPFGNIDLLNDKDRVEKFIFAETFPTKDQQIDSYLQAHKTELMERKIKKFSEKNWFEWGAPRNLSSIRKHWGKPCIYVRNMTRNKEVAFLGKVQYFGGALLCLVPQAEMNEKTLQNVINLLNQSEFQKDYIYSGRFKIGHKQLSNALLPT